MIEKKIHYIWVGRNPLPPLAIKCIDSWKKHCPDYEIIEWNEDNFDIHANLYCKQAYESRKWAFVSDYMRLHILYNHGGIYMDTDVEVIKPIDEFLHLQAFSGFESSITISTGIMAAQKGNVWIKELLKYYDKATFIKSNGKLNLTTNVITITKDTKKLYPKLKLNNTEQHFEHVSFYPSEYFCPFNCDTRSLNLTPNTFAIHHFVASWSPKNYSNSKIKYLIKKIIGNNLLYFYRRLRYKI